MVPKWAKHGPGMVLKSTLSVYIVLDHVDSALNISGSSWSKSKARLNMVPAWSKHGPNMFLKSTHSVDIGLRPS